MAHSLSSPRFGVQAPWTLC